MLTGMAIRVVVADDSYLIREAVTQLLGWRDDIELVASCEDLPSLLEAIDAHVPDVVLTDIRMPPDGREEGIRAAEYARENHPAMGVVVLSQFAGPAYALALLEKGSARRGYLLKERVSDREQCGRDQRGGRRGLCGRPAGCRRARRGFDRGRRITAFAADPAMG
jgi:DNA-binding NarL/FixJ family response regulator